MTKDMCGTDCNEVKQIPLNTSFCSQFGNILIGRGRHLHCKYGDRVLKQINLTVLKNWSMLNSVIRNDFLHLTMISFYPY